jgi:hypothetical protein
MSILTIAALGVLATAVVVVGLLSGVSAAERRGREELRARGTVCRAVIRHLVGRGPNVGITFEIHTPGGVIGRTFGGLGDRGYDLQALTDAMVAGRELEILFHPEARTVLIKTPGSSEFR